MKLAMMLMQSNCFNQISWMVGLVLNEHLLLGPPITALHSQNAIHLMMGPGCNAKTKNVGAKGN